MDVPQRVNELTEVVRRASRVPKAHQLRKRTPSLRIPRFGPVEQMCDQQLTLARVPTL